MCVKAESAEIPAPMVYLMEEETEAQGTQPSGYRNETRKEASGPDPQGGIIPFPTASCPGHPLTPIFNKVFLTPVLQLEKSLIFPLRLYINNSIFFFFSNSCESHFLRLADHHVIPFLFY